MPSDAQWKKCGVRKIENFTSVDRQVINNYYPLYYHKTDKDGRPIYIERLGMANVDALKTVDQERILNRLVLEYDEFFNKRLPKCKGPDGGRVTTCCTILDLKGLSIPSPSEIKYLLGYLRRASKVGDGYPDCMAKFYIINAPMLFSLTWKAIKPVLSEEKVDKIHIVSEKKVKATLLSQILAKDLPVEFGGTCQCPGGCSRSDAGPWNH